MRMGTFRTAQRLSNMKIVDQKFKNFCPCYNLCVPETVDHILLSCSRWRNHQSTTWENLISSDCDYYPECDSTILWSDITNALRDTPNNKAPGADGVPSE
ncbi:hypothetical protein AYI70_g11091, partial [Smittium culicis]